MRVTFHPDLLPQHVLSSNPHWCLFPDALICRLRSKFAPSVSPLTAGCLIGFRIPSSPQSFQQALDNSKRQRTVGSMTQGAEEDAPADGVAASAGKR